MEKPNTLIDSRRRVYAIALALIAFGVIMRLVPHPPNFAPIGAIAIFGGAVLPRKHALWVPLAAMVMSDLVIGFYNGIVFTWAAFLLVGLFGMTLRRSGNWLRIGLGAFGGALIFFTVSNFGVWVAGGLYAHTWAGLVQCFAMALPFFRNTLAGDLVYNAVLFGVFALAIRPLVAKDLVPSLVPEEPAAD